jgi:hypothetical protein
MKDFLCYVEGTKSTKHLVFFGQRQWFLLMLNGGLSIWAAYRRKEKRINVIKYAGSVNSCFKRYNKQSSPELIETICLMQRRQDWLRSYQIENGSQPLDFAASFSKSNDVEIAKNKRCKMT